MIKIIEHGKRTAECNYCGCKIKYEAEDMKSNFEIVGFFGVKKYYYYVRCPDCGNKIFICWV